MAQRLVRVAKEINVGTSTIVAFLKSHGFKISNVPTARISKDAYELLQKEFSNSVAIKESMELLNTSIELDWEILRSDSINDINIQKTIRKKIKKLNERNEFSVIVQNHIDYLIKFKPDFVAKGKKGFKGYLVFGFKQKGLFIMESLKWGNATYIFDDNWIEFSKLSKREILNGNLHLNRIYHKINWKRNINKFLISG